MRLREVFELASNHIAVTSKISAFHPDLGSSWLLSSLLHQRNSAQKLKTKIWSVFILMLNVIKNALHVH